MEKIRIVIADDIQAIREHFRDVLSGEKNMVVVGAASSGKEAVRVVMKEQPDILLVDIQMDAYDDGLNAIKQIIELGSKTSSIVLSAHQEDELIFRAFEYGAVNYILKDESAAVIIRSIIDAYYGEVTLQPNISEKLKKEFRRMKTDQHELLILMGSLFKLTKTELIILQLLVKGNTISDICDSRYIEESTLRTHINNILKKFQMHKIKSVIDFVKKYNKNGFMEKYFE